MPKPRSKRETFGIERVEELASRNEQLINDETKDVWRQGVMDYTLTRAMNANKKKSNRQEYLTSLDDIGMDADDTTMTTHERGSKRNHQGHHRPPTKRGRNHSPSPSDASDSDGNWWSAKVTKRRHAKDKDSSHDSDRSDSSRSRSKHNRRHGKPSKDKDRRGSKDKHKDRDRHDAGMGHTSRDKDCGRGMDRDSDTTHGHSKGRMGHHAKDIAGANPHGSPMKGNTDHRPRHSESRPSSSTTPMDFTGHPQTPNHMDDDQKGDDTTAPVKAALKVMASVASDASCRSLKLTDVYVTVKNLQRASQSMSKRVCNLSDAQMRTP